MLGPGWLPIAWAAIWLATLGVAFFSLSWPFVDVYRVISDAAASSWSEYVGSAFFRDVEYRPLFSLAVKASYHVVGLRLWVYEALVLLQFGVLLSVVIWMLRPLTWPRALAASIALSCIIGLHTSRILLGFWPLNFGVFVLTLMLATIAAASDARARSFDWLFFPVIVIALLSLESGIIIAALVAVLWWFDAPGLSFRGVAGSAAAVLVYVAIRLSLGRFDQPLGIYTGSGLGFSDANPEMLRNIFEHATWLFWTYNVIATALTVLVSEPRAGVYRFVQSLLRGDTPLWLWIHVGSSILTTALIVAAFVTRGLWASRDRLLVIGGLVLIACGSALGFLYTRDRIGLPVGVGYALLLYVAIVRLLASPALHGWKRALAITSVGLIAVAWVIRSGETYFQLRDAAWDYHVEWTDRWAELGGAQPSTPLLTTLRAAALRDTPADPRGDPAWTYALFERRFTPGGEARRTPDANVDEVERPSSGPFDIRWRSETSGAERQGYEAQLGLIDGQRVERDPRGQTWTYRLRQPTQERVRSIIEHDAVEDTARVNVDRYEIDK